MADYGVFVGFNYPARGREEAAVKSFGELMQFLGQQQSQRNVESFQPVFLQAHGGDLGGFVLVNGEREKLDRMVASDDFQQLIQRAQLCVDGLGVVNYITGNEVQRSMGLFQEMLASVR